MKDAYSPEVFLTLIRRAAETVQLETGIPWLFAATQAAHESRFGNSKLAIEANNLFGITGDSWYVKGLPVYWVETKEYNKSGQAFRMRRPFRRYANWEESLRDWADLIKRRYRSSYEAALADEFVGFAKGLQAGGYATDPKYATKLVALHRAVALSADKTPLESKDRPLLADSGDDLLDQSKPS